LRALVVDDEPSLVRAVAGYLEHDGFVVTTAADGEQALAAARSDPPDVIVLDLGLPGIDGIEVCRQLRTFTDAT
jgi:DNA-binding response OmpR family regulator